MAKFAEKVRCPAENHSGSTRIIPRAVIIALIILTTSGLVTVKTGKDQLAIVYTKDIKLYEDLKNTIVKHFKNKLEINVFETSRDRNSRLLEHKLKKVKPAVIVSIGNTSAEFCSKLGIAAVIAAYDGNLLSRQNPFSTLNYLRPKAKKLVGLFDSRLAKSRSDFLTSMAAGYNLKLTVESAKPDSVEQLFTGNDALYLSRGALIFNCDVKNNTPKNGGTIIIADRSIKVYRQLGEICLAQLPGINKVIDISALKNDQLHKRLVKEKPANIICVGANTFSRCRTAYTDAALWVAVKTFSDKTDINQWAYLCGINTLTEPKDQIEALRLLVKKPINLAVPYDPQNSELLVLKALLTETHNISIIPLPASETKDAGKIMAKVFDDYDGLWLIPDETLCLVTFRRLLLEQSLQRQKILVTMMHTFTKAGALMAVGTVGDCDAESCICHKVIDMINQHLSQPEHVEKLIPATAYLSVNVRTAEKLNYIPPVSLLNRADFIFGKE